VDNFGRLWTDFLCPLFFYTISLPFSTRGQVWTGRGQVFPKKSVHQLYALIWAQKTFFPYFYPFGQLGQVFK